MSGPPIPVAPEFFVRDLDASLRFYVEGLGFQVVRESQGFAVIGLGRAILLLATPLALPGDEAAAAVTPWLAGGPRGIGVNVLIMVDDVDEMYERATAVGAPIFWEIGDRYYGLRDFIVQDPDGFCVRFASALKAGG